MILPETPSFCFPFRGISEHDTHYPWLEASLNYWSLVSDNNPSRGASVPNNAMIYWPQLGSVSNSKAGTLLNMDQYISEFNPFYAGRSRDLNR